MPCPSIAVLFQALLTSLLRVLFSFRSLYYCAIGLKICLALEVSVPRFPRDIRPTVLKLTLHPTRSSNGTITLYGNTFQCTLPYTSPD